MSFLFPRQAPAGPIKMATPSGVAIFMERLMGVEPTYAAWEAAVLPMNYSRISGLERIIADSSGKCNTKNGVSAYFPRRRHRV